MKFCKERILKNGKKIFVRNLVESDAEILSEYRKTLLKQRGFMIDETTITKDKQLDFINGIKNSKRIIYLVAVTLDNKIVGHVEMKLKDNLSMLVRNDLKFGVLEEFCGVNLINLLAECIVDCANDYEFIKMERLTYSAQNKYERAKSEFNFQKLDKVATTLKFIVGKYADEIYMNEIYKVKK